MKFESQNSYKFQSPSGTKNLYQSMTTLEDQKTWLRQYTAQDLTRTLVRQYLYQHNMFKTLNCFENEDKQNSRKIIKSTLIKMLCVNNLVVNNKKIDKDKQSKSLLLLLVKYLRGKFEQRVSKEENQQILTKSEKNNKEFSMNGDNVLPYTLNQGNKIKQKNMVSTKRKENDQKTLTQEGFYKKKELTKFEQPKPFKKSSNMEQKQQKNKYSARPSTANPNIKPKKEDQKVSSIYSKLNTNVKTRKESQRKEQDQSMKVVKINTPTESPKEQSTHVSKSSKHASVDQRGSNNLQVKVETKSGNSAINRNSKQQQKAAQQKRQNTSQTPQKTTQTKVNTLQQAVKINNFQAFKQLTRDIDSKKSERVIQEPQVKKDQQVEEEYFNEFEEQLPVREEKNINKNQEIKPIKHESKEKQTNFLKNEPQKKQPQPSSNFFLAQKVQTSGSQKIQSKQSQKVQTTKPIEMPVKQDAYMPTSQVQPSRRGRKLLRKTGKQFTQNQDATEMIGKDVKLLADDVIPGQDDFFKNSQKIPEMENKPQKKQLNFQKPQKSQSEPIKQSKESTVSSQNTVNPVRELKLKKKLKNNDQQEQPVSSKFKFDQNFVDEPLFGKKEKYTYQKFQFQKMTIQPQLKPKASSILLESNINYLQKPTSDSSSLVKKKNQRPLSSQKAQQLKKIVFQKGNPYLPKAWHQGFILSPCSDTFYGLKQIQGGPCGIIAAMQCYYLKHLLYMSKPSVQNDLKNDLRRQTCLVAALTDILWKAKGQNDKIFLVIPTNRNFSGPKLQISNLMEVQIEASSFEIAYESIWSYKSSFIGNSNHGVTVLIYSIIMTKGIDKIYNEVDMRENPLIGHHGHCTQELVNLFIAGQASSNCFDGKKELQQGFTLHGISQKSQFGFLTVFQTLQYIQVGKNLKNPLFPIWIISKQFHYHVIFGNHYLISENNDCQKFDLIYFDGLYACDKFIRLTFDQVEKDAFGMVVQQGKIKDLPLIQQVLLKKWGRRKVDWNGSTKIL